ncbi:MAG TPA: hypothetical protein PKG60_07625 [Spirochaetota bacterium]|nr:hypothetical protein [Spirochaetota bacterium]
MDKIKIVIVTGTGGILGTGHIQRMLNLAVHLNRTDIFSALIYLKQEDHPLERKFAYMLTDSISQDTGLIIRDMRDSSVEEIQMLKQAAPVLAIDDSGAGRISAAYSLNLLPVPSDDKKNIIPDPSLFLYGYNFAEGINNLKEKNSLKRDIDITVYAGYDPSPELISSIKKSIPGSASSVLLKGGKAINFTGEIIQQEIPYAEIISRSKIIITHFGLTMFEADACGCKIAALNPTSYHSSLTDMVRQDLRIIYLSEYSQFSPDNLKDIIRHELKSANDKNFSPSDILKKINKCTENFIDYIDNICNKL